MLKAKLRVIAQKYKRQWDFENKVKTKLTKIGAKGTEEPLYCQHEHCKWWQLKHYLVSEKTKQKTIKELNEVYKKKQEAKEE